MEDAMKQVMAYAVADKIVEALNGPQRDAILANAVKEMLTGYEIKSACKELLEERAKKIAAEVINTGCFDKDIEAEIRKGFDKVMTLVADASRDAMLKAIVGERDDNRGYGGEPGLILKAWKLKE